MFEKTKLLVVLSICLFGLGVLLSGGIASAASCTGIVPAHAEMYFGDEMEITTDTPYVYSAVNNWNKRCEFTCSAGYIWNGNACVLPTPSCIGTIPQHAEMYFGDDMMITVNTPYVHSTVNTWNKLCEYTCSAGYAWNGYACAAISYSCTGLVSAHAEMYFGDEMMLIANTPFVYSAGNNWNKPCEFTCSVGYRWNGYACVLPTASCTGTVPAHAEMYFGDDMMLTANTPFVHSAVNNWNKLCEYTCSAGYRWNDYACVLSTP